MDIINDTVTELSAGDSSLTAPGEINHLRCFVICSFNGANKIVLPDHTPSFTYRLSVSPPREFGCFSVNGMGAGWG